MKFSVTDRMRSSESVTIGCATGYNLAHIRPFVASHVEHVPKGTLFLLLDRDNKALLRGLAEYGERVVPVPVRSSRVFRAANRVHALFPMSHLIRGLLL